MVLSISSKFPKNTIFFGNFFVWFTRDGEIEGLRSETCYPQFRALMFSRLTCDVTN